MELIYFVLVGAVAGVLARKIMKMESSLVMTSILGIVGGFLGGWGLSQIGISLPWGMVGDIITSALGAVILVFMYKLVSK